MATVSGTLTTHNGAPYVGQVRFDNIDAPAVVGSDLVTGIHDGLLVATDASGRFTTTLRAGYYRVAIAAARAYRILVPDDGGSYDLRSLAVPQLPHYTGIGVERANTVYWGKNASLFLSNQTQVKALGSSRSQTSAGNSYDFPITAGPEYAFLTWPANWPAPAAPNGFMINGFPAVMAGDAESYGSVEVNGYRRDELTVDSISFAVYRLANPTSGEFSVVVSV